jgi:hypothetical protein
MLFRTHITMTFCTRVIFLVWVLALAITPAAASDTSTTICALSADLSKVIRWNAASSTWNQVGGAASAIYGGPVALLATNPDNTAVFEYTSGTWKAIGNGGAQFVQVYGALYGLTPNKGAVWEYLGLGPSSWIEIGGAAGKLYAGAVSEFFATTPAGHELWHLVSGSTWEQMLFFEVPADFAVDKDGNAYFLSDEGLFLWSGNGTSWIPILGCPASGAMYVGEFGVFAGGTSLGLLYHYTGGEEWPIIGVGGESYAVSDEGVYAMDLGGAAAYKWSGSGTIWEELQGSGTVSQIVPCP